MGLAIRLGAVVSHSRREALRFSIPLGQRVALGKDACHFRHVLGPPGAQRDDRVSQAATERGQRVVHARRHFLVVGPR
jgi:hypothetical protein